MKLTELKGRVDFRMKPLLNKGVRVLWQNSEFAIMEYDYFDSSTTFIIHVSDRKEPLEFDPSQMIIFLDTIKRKDGILVPAFDSNGSEAERQPTREAAPVKVKQQAVKVKAEPVMAAPEEEEDEDIYTALPEDEDETYTVLPEAGATRRSAFVHVDSLVKVYVTNEYSRFGILVGNRSLNKTKIKKILDEIAGGTNLLQYCPIVVVEKDGKLKVVDGQHRLEVAKQINSQVWYVISQELSLYEIAKMNSNTEKWTGKDYINCYAQAGNRNYKIVSEFITSYGFPLTISLMLLAKGRDAVNGGHEQKRQSDNFQKGCYTVHKLDEAEMIGNEILRFGSFSGCRSGNFIIAICKIIIARKIEMDEVVSAFESHPDALKVQKDWKNYMVNLEQVVNIGKSKRRVIYE